MKKVNIIFPLYFFLLISIFGCSDEENTPTENNQNGDVHPGYELAWSDEFEGTEIDLNKWEHEVNASGGGNNELQYYTARPENSFVQDGHLHIVAIQDEYTAEEGTRYYTSARMRTPNKGDWKYARVDVKAKVPVGQGVWPAIWMLPTDWEYGGWPNSGEIDIMEHINLQTEIHGTVHTEAYNHKRGTQRGGRIEVPDADENFHVYSIVWTEDKIDFLVDDQQYYTFSNDGKGDSATWPFDKRFHLILNVAIGGDWPGDPTTDTRFPKEMIIDYVRVYQEKE